MTELNWRPLMIFQTKKLFIVASSLIFVNCAPLRQKPENNSVVKQDTEPFVQIQPDRLLCGTNVTQNNYHQWILGVGTGSSEYGQNWYKLSTPDLAHYYYAKVKSISGDAKIRQKIGDYYIDMKKMSDGNINILVDSFSKGLGSIARFKENRDGSVTYENGSEWIKPSTFSSPSSQVAWLYRTKTDASCASCASCATCATCTTCTTCTEGVDHEPPTVLTIFKGCVDSIGALSDSVNKIIVIETHETFLNIPAQTTRHYYARSYGLVKVSTVDSFGREGLTILNFGGNLNYSDPNGDGISDNEEFKTIESDNREYCSTPDIVW